MDTQELVKGSWDTCGLTPCFHLTSASQQDLQASFPAATTGLRAVFVPSSTDVTNVSYYSGWFYFEVVK